MLYGTQGRTLETPLPSGVFVLGEVRISQLHLTAAVVSWLCMAGFGAFFRYTSVGLLMRATANSHEAAMVSGVNVNRVNRMAWAIGTALAAIGGLFLGQLQIASVGINVQVFKSGTAGNDDFPGLDGAMPSSATTAAAGRGSVR